MRTYSFRTTLLVDDINPVTPIHRERLVPDTNCVILDCTTAPTLVTVNGTTVWDGAPQGGWSGYLITDWEEGIRLVLDPPAPFTVGDSKTVAVTTSMATLEYTWACGTRQITTSDDCASPRVTEATAAYPYAGYVREFVPADIHRLTTHSDICLRHADPLTGEVQVVPGYVFDIGYDPTLNKLVVFYVHSGKIFVTTAVPGDDPTTLIQSDEVVGDPTLVLKAALRNDLPLRGTGPGYVPLFNDPMGPVITPYIPVKLYTPDTVRLRGSGSGYFPTRFADDKLAYIIDVLTETATPFVLSAPNVDYDTPGTVRIGIPRVTGAPETTFLVGYQLFKLHAGLMHSLGFFPMAPGASYMVVTDTMFNPGARYAVMPIYQQGKRTQMRGSIGAFASMPTYSEPLDLTPPTGAGYYPPMFTDGWFTITPFPPLKQAVLDTARLRAAGCGYNWRVTAVRGSETLFDVGGLL